MKGDGNSQECNAILTRDSNYEVNWDLFCCGTVFGSILIWMSAEKETEYSQPMDRSLARRFSPTPSHSENAYNMCIM